MVVVYSIIRPLLFKLPPERAHALSLRALRLSTAVPVASSVVRGFFAPRFVPPRTAQTVRVFGLAFPNVLGVAAGYDKDGLAWRGLAALGFGHVEVGTVTPRAQTGNPPPRLFRLAEDRAIINRLGFPSRGAAFVAQRLMAARPAGFVLGVNIGKNKDTPLENAAADYISLIETFAPLADYIAVNISSPNTEGLRRLQAREAMDSLLVACVRQRDISRGERRLPLLVKLSPDLTLEELDDALDVITRAGIDGVILTNTTISRDGLRAAQELASEKGGLSGPPLRQRSTEFVRHAHGVTGGRLPIIGVGGVDSPEAAKEKLDAGASLVQLYTSLVYEGPGLARKIIGNGE